MKNNENTSKQILTKSAAAKDIKGYATETIIRASAVIIFIAISVTLLVNAFRDLPTYYFLSLAPLVAIAISAIGPLIRSSVLIYRVVCGRFYITTSTLTKSYQKEGWRSSNPTFMLLFRKPYRLQFTSYGEYLIPEGKNYKWSEKHCMDAKSVYDYSIIGDEFYVVVINNTICYAYNKKLFELEK